MEARPTVGSQQPWPVVAGCTTAPFEPRKVCCEADSQLSDKILGRSKWNVFRIMPGTQQVLGKSLFIRDWQALQQCRPASVN